MKMFRRRSLGKRFAAGLVAVAFALAMLGMGGGGALAANDPSACQAPTAPNANAGPGATTTQAGCAPETAGEAGTTGSPNEAPATGGTTAGNVTGGAATGGETGGTATAGTVGDASNSGGVAGDIQACVITAGDANAASNVVVIAPGQGQGQATASAPTAPPAAASAAAAAPVSASSSAQAGTAGTCETGAFAPAQGGAPIPSAQVCSITGAAGSDGGATPGTVPAGAVIVVGDAQFCASAGEAGDTAAAGSAPDNCVNLAPAAIQNSTAASTANGETGSASGGSVIVIGSTQANPVAANGDVRVCTGDTVNIAPATAASGSTCTIALPDGSTSNGVVIIANGALNCMGNAAPAAPAANAPAPANAPAGGTTNAGGAPAPGVTTAPGTATQTP